MLIVNLINLIINLLNLYKNIIHLLTLVYFSSDKSLVNDQFVVVTVLHVITSSCFHHNKNFANRCDHMDWFYNKQIFIFWKQWRGIAYQACHLLYGRTFPYYMFYCFSMSSGSTNETIHLCLKGWFLVIHYLKDTNFLKIGQLILISDKCYTIYLGF